MLVTFFITFTYNIVNHPLLPSSLESRLLPPVLLPNLMPLCTFNYFVASYTWLIHILIFPLLLVFFLGICKHAMKSIGNQLKQYFGISVVWFISEYITVQGGLLYWSISLIHIGPTTMMIGILLYVMFSSLVQDLSLGPIRNNRIFLFLQWNKNTKQYLMQVRKPCGFESSFQSLDSSTSIWPSFGVIIRVSSSSPNIQFNIITENTLIYTCTSSESSFMIELLKFSYALENIELQKFSQSLL